MLEPGPAVHTPPQAVSQKEVRSLHYILVARGILWRSLTLLVANEPKPWSNRVKRLRQDMAKAHGIMNHAVEEYDLATIKEALRYATRTED